MENLIFVIVFIVLTAYVWNKFVSLFSKKSKKSSSIATRPISNDPREKAISELMAKVQKAKLNRPEIIAENPQRAAQVIKSWVKKDEKK